MQPVIDIYATNSERDLGAVSRDIQAIIDETAKEAPPGATVVLRGQTATMESAYRQLLIGLALAIVFIYLLIVVNFQSWLDPFVIVAALPTALAGIVWMLFATETTLSVPALTGAIMCMGVATANSILVVSFARERLAAGDDPLTAAMEAGFHPLPSGVDDRSRDDHRHGADGAERRAECAAGPGGHRRPDLFDDRDAVVCPRGVSTGSRPQAEDPIAARTRDDPRGDLRMKHDPPPAPAEGPPSLRPVKALRFVLLIALVAVSVAAMGVTSRRKDEEKLARWTVDQATPDVAVIKATRDDHTKQIALPGDVEAYDSASIHGQVSGYVREWRVDIGARVKKGQVLAVVDTPELDQRVTASEGELAKAKAKQVFAGVTANRWKTLGGSAAVSQQAIDEKASDVLVTDADVSAARADLDRLHALKAFSNITAPFDGVVTARDVDIGSLVMPGSAANKPLFVVADLSQVRVYVHAPQVYGAEMKEGMQAKLILPEYPGREFPARISTTSNAIDAKSRSLLVELIANNSDGLLKPGAFAQVNFQLPPNSQSVTLPASALLFRDEAILVATVDEKSHIKMKKIRIARDYGSRVEVADGLSPDDEIVKNPLESMSDGDQVRIVSRGSGEDAGGAKANPKLAEGAMK